MARTQENETDELTRKARGLEDAIDETRTRIRKLQGLPTGGDERARWWKTNAEVEVEHDLPALDPALAHEALFEAIYEETGLIGAVRTTGSEFEWRVFDEQRSPQRLKVRLEGGLHTPRLRLSGRAPDQQHRSALAVIAGITVMVMLVLALAVLTLPIAPWILMSVVSVGSLALLFGVLFTRRRRTQRSLRQLAQRIAEPLPLQATLARVEVDATEEDEEVEAEAGPETKRSARGVS